MANMKEDMETAMENMKEDTETAMENTKADMAIVTENMKEDTETAMANMKEDTETVMANTKADMATVMANMKEDTETMTERKKVIMAVIEGTKARVDAMESMIRTEIAMERMASTVIMTASMVMTTKENMEVSIMEVTVKNMEMIKKTEREDIMAVTEERANMENPASTERVPKWAVPVVEER